METRERELNLHEMALTRTMGRIFLLIIGLKPAVYLFISVNQGFNVGQNPTIYLMSNLLEICTWLLLLIFGWLLLDRICNLCINTARVRQRLEAEDPSAKAPPV